VAKASSKSSSKNSSVDHPKALIIAEKPSVANDIAKALGGCKMGIWFSSAKAFTGLS
jgi:hypothetical protein